ncbi:MAG: NERD domain-containing protein [Gallionella sp.]|nr:NERD domain-containing protein [Gallionella sp.]
MLIKSADDKSKRLRLLDELQKSDRLDDRQKKWLRDEYWRLAPGVAGEQDAAHYLDMVFQSAKNSSLLHDLRLEADGQVAQIDHLLISRTFTFFLLETKSFRGSLHINEQGEFTVEYEDSRRYGIESPLEQSRRHEIVLRKVLDRLGISGRIGTEPTFQHVVLVHPKAVIHRPPATALDTSMVIKADQFLTWLDRYIDAHGVVGTLAWMLNFRGQETVKEWGEQLKAEHRPTSPLDLPPFMKPKAPPIVQLSTRHLGAEVPTKPPTPARERDGAVPVCFTCGMNLTPKAVKYCQDKAAWFGGKLYCFKHQSAAKQA